MKINLNRPLLDFKGNEAIKVVNGKEVKQYLRNLSCSGTVSCCDVHSLFPPSIKS